MSRVKISFFEVFQINMSIEMGNVCNQFLMSSVLVSLYAVTKVLSQIWGTSFCPLGRGHGGTFSTFVPVFTVQKIRVRYKRGG